MEQIPLICSQCKVNFDLNDHIPLVIPECGHTLCQACINTNMININSKVYKCLIDNKETKCQKIEEFPKNLFLIQLIENMKSSSINKKLCSQHKKALKVVCMDEKVTLCTNCALFGGHKNHELRKIEEVIKEIELRTECLNEMIQLFKNGDSLFTTKSDLKIILDLLREKETQYKNNVKEKFKKIKELIEEKEKNIETILNSFFKSSEDKIQYFIDAPTKLKDQTNIWILKAQNILKLVEEQSKINGIGYAILEDKRNKEDIIISGNQLLSELTLLKEGKGINEIKEMITKINVIFNVGFEDFVDHLCVLKGFEDSGIFNEENLENTEINLPEELLRFDNISPHLRFSISKDLRKSLSNQQKPE